MSDSRPLEPTPERMRQMCDAVVDRVIAHLTSLDQQAARGPLDDAAERCRQMREAPPDQGTELEALLEPLFDDWALRSFNTAGPGYMAYMPGGGLLSAALADLIANSLNRFTGVWNAAPLLVQLEANVLDWLRQWMGFPPDARGLLTTGGSMATFTAVVTARERELGTALRDGVVYTSKEAHGCIEKAARMAGILSDRVRLIEVDERQRMRVDELASAVAEDRRRGLRPFLVASTAGTVNSGAVDPIASIGELCRREGLWHHCDGAYGGFFQLCPALRAALAGLSEVDSLVLDPHKGLFLPYGTGALLVRDGHALERAHRWSAGYLPPLPEADLYNPCQHGPELSRDFRGLRLWLSLKLHGIDAFRSALAEKRELACWAAEQLADTPTITVLDPPALSLFAFRVGGDDHATRELVEGVAKRGNVLLSGATIGERFYARLCVLSFRTHREHVAQCVDDIRAVVAEPV